MKYQAVLFDLDGTLLDTLGDIGGTLNHVLVENGYRPHTMAEYRHLVGNGARRLTKDALPDDTPEDEVERIFLLYRDYYRDHPCSVTVPYAGAEELLEQLHSRGISAAVVSNKPEPTARKLIDRFFPGVLAVGDDGVHPRKPAPDNVYRALEQLGVAPEQALYVGDSEVDAATAKNAGMDAAIVGWGYRDRDFLLAHGASEVVDTFDRLLEKILKTPG
ncbi:MAG: HAD-IA family hydrolase [Oscillospiraceae bacterium]|nr:HAD-IA family hydrolase [Oscillospiraceae bacterium]